jgi:hypothetical protein
MSQTQVGPDRRPYPGTPRWVKIFGIITLVAVALFLVLLLTRGPHGSGHHTAGGGASMRHTPPEGAHP